MTRAPMRPCLLCGIVPTIYLVADEWVIECRSCGRSVRAETEDGCREQWATENEPKISTSREAALDLLNSIEDAFADLECIRKIPGAMNIWHKISDEIANLRNLMEAAEWD